MNRLQIVQLEEMFGQIRDELKTISSLNYKSVADRVDTKVKEIEMILKRIKRDM